jgi:hypothetical protein
LRRISGRIEDDQMEMLEEAGMERQIASRLVDIIEGTDAENSIIVDSE